MAARKLSSTVRFFFDILPVIVVFGEFLQRRKFREILFVGRLWGRVQKTSAPPLKSGRKSKIPAWDFGQINLHLIKMRRGRHYLNLWFYL
jgi:hypothetical protein